jgi:hypothetical protein
MHRMFRTSALLAVFAVALVAGMPPAHARLAHSRFSRLLSESELIVRVRVTAVHLEPKIESGYVMVEVLETYKGTAPTSPIRISYSGEVHDQRMKQKGEERLLFLARRDGQWTGTHYGRSYWWLVPAADPAVGQVSPLRYPTTMLKFDGAHRKLLRPARFGGPMPVAYPGERIEKMIALSDVVRAIAR